MISRRRFALSQERRVIWVSKWKGEFKMAKLSKRLKLIQEKLPSNKNPHTVLEALALLKELSTVKFNESIDVSINLGIDSRKSDQAVRGAVVLPHGTGRTTRVAVFAQ